MPRVRRVRHARTRTRSGQREWVFATGTNFKVASTGHASPTMGSAPACPGVDVAV